MQKIRNSNLKRKLSTIDYLLNFPTVLVLVHFKKNLSLILFLLIFTVILGGGFGQKFGVQDLFLFPEYLGKVNLLSHFIHGLCFGGFLIAFQISSYINNSFRFPFLATVKFPFYKYVLNNQILTGALVFFGTIQLYFFQTEQELIAPSLVWLNIAGLLAGVLAVHAFTLFYFTRTNKHFDDFFKSIDITTPQKKKKHVAVSSTLHRGYAWYRYFRKGKEWPVKTYWASPIRLKIARDCSHYAQSQLQQVFAQNHINASFFEIGLILLVLVLGFFSEVEALLIPAASSFFLLMAVFLMLASALQSWFASWSNFIIIAGLLSLNFASEQGWLKLTNNAFGINYEHTADYSGEALATLANNQASLTRDSLQTIEILNNWKGNRTKPTLVLLNVSGGGSRSAVWTARNLALLDSITNQQFLKNIHLLSGSSGGMIGGLLARELEYNRRKNQEKLDWESTIQQLDDDLLNPVLKTHATNDLFLRLRYWEDDYHTVPKDRAYIFEQSLNKNTNNALDYRLSKHQNAELKANISRTVITPSIINDGRILNISAWPCTFLQSKTEHSGLTLPESVDWWTLFENNDPGNLYMTSAIRMNATFPYVLPQVSLPTKPAVKVMDAGLRDNVGIETATKYLLKFQDWITENCEQVLIVEIRDKQRHNLSIQNSRNSLSEAFFTPAGTFYQNWLTTQMFHQDLLFSALEKGFKIPVRKASLSLYQNPDKQISLSWHLTQTEKDQIKSAVVSERNLKVLHKIKDCIANN